MIPLLFRKKYFIMYIVELFTLITSSAALPIQELSTIRSWLWEIFPLCTMDTKYQIATIYSFEKFNHILPRAPYLMLTRKAISIISYNATRQGLSTLCVYFISLIWSTVLPLLVPPKNLRSQKRRHCYAYSLFLGRGN